MLTTITRRTILAGATLAALGWRSASSRQSTPGSTVAGWALPIRNAGEVPGDGFLIRHGFATENTWFNPGWLHTAEDWYRANDAETAGAEVLAATDGEVVWIGSEYPGRVILIEHADGLYGMYGHIDHDLDVAEGDRVQTGQVVGRVLQWTDGRAPSHLHFEMRNFVINPVVNGDNPAYATGCGVQCPPGPGYWPIGDPRHPVELGWRNPTHMVAEGMATAPPPSVVVAETASGTMGTIRSAPSDEATVISELPWTPGERHELLGIEAGAPDGTGTSALGYDVWFRIAMPDDREGWTRALLPDADNTGSDGRPSSLRPVLLAVTSEPDE